MSETTLEDKARADWRRAVSEADDQTLKVIRTREQEEADRHQRNADFYQWRADVITAELGHRAHREIVRGG